MTEDTNFSRHQNLFNTLHNMGYILLESELQEVVSAVEKDKMEAKEDFSGWTQDDEIDEDYELSQEPCSVCGDIDGMVNRCCAGYDPLHYKNCGYG